MITSTCALVRGLALGLALGLNQPTHLDKAAVTGCVHCAGLHRRSKEASEPLVQGHGRLIKLQLDLKAEAAPIGDRFCPFEQLRDGPWELRLAGDAVGPRLLEAATFEGNLAVRSLEAGWVRPAVRFGQTGSAI